MSDLSEPLGGVVRRKREVTVWPSPREDALEDLVRAVSSCSNSPLLAVATMTCETGDRVHLLDWFNSASSDDMRNAAQSDMWLFCAAVRTRSHATLWEQWRAARFGRPSQERGTHAFLDPDSLNPDPAVAIS